MELKVPYDEVTLKKSLGGASAKLEVAGLQEGILERITKTTAQSQAEFNRFVSEFHGIGVSDLVNSPNYEKLKEDYGVHHVSQIHRIYLESGFTDIESWALICVGFDKLDGDLE